MPGPINYEPVVRSVVYAHAPAGYFFLQRRRSWIQQLVAGVIAQLVPEQPLGTIEFGAHSRADIRPAGEVLGGADKQHMTPRLVRWGGDQGHVVLLSQSLDDCVSGFWRREIGKNVMHRGAVV